MHFGQTGCEEQRRDEPRCSQPPNTPLALGFPSWAALERQLLHLVGMALAGLGLRARSLVPPCPGHAGSPRPAPSPDPTQQGRPRMVDNGHVEEERSTKGRLRTKHRPRSSAHDGEMEAAVLESNAAPPRTPGSKGCVRGGLKNMVST